jgi:nitroimidazol reductase NimA-like FMN-containing flavoprotein (pyridoxamine 5'-phosphate oxidase superfamily)
VVWVTPSRTLYRMEPVLAALSREQCLRLMATAPVGRVIYTRQAMPAVELVNFTVDTGDIVIRTAASGKLIAAISGAIVAFEADAYDPVTRSGWSVTAVGKARDVTDPADIERFRTIGPHLWVPGERPYFVRITPGTLNGRRLSPGCPPVNGAGSGLEAPGGLGPPPAPAPAPAP